MKQKFILTIDSNKLAKWLRLLGYDTKVIKSISLLNLIRIARKDNRIIVTRSKEVLKHPVEFDRIYIHADKYHEQLLELKELITFKEDEIFTRCPEDNTELTPIDKSKILHLIPEEVAKNYEEFKVCHKCGRVYWQGTHFDKIKVELRNVFTD